MLSATEHWAGGTTASGAIKSKILALHSTDGGQTYASEDGGITSQMITDMDFVTKDLGYATTISALNVCNLLKFSA